MKDLQKPGADIDSDHNLLVMKIYMSLKEITQFPRKVTQKWNLEKLCAQKEKAQECTVHSSLLKKPLLAWHTL